MTQLLYLISIFFAKVLDSTLNTGKTILIQRNKRFWAALTVVVSNCIYFMLVKNVLTADSDLAILIVSLAAGCGCCLAVTLSNRFSRDRTYINVILSDDRDAMQRLRDYLAQHHITNVASDCYTMDWDKKTIAITAYARTKAESCLIDAYLEQAPVKFKRMIQK